MIVEAVLTESESYIEYFSLTDIPCMPGDVELEICSHLIHGKNPAEPRTKHRVILNRERLKELRDSIDTFLEGKSKLVEKPKAVLPPPKAFEIQDDQRFVYPQHQHNEEINSEIGLWIQKTKLNISTTMPQAGYVWSNRYRRALKIFLDDFLTKSKTYPRGKWRITVTLPEVDVTHPVIRQESMIKAMNRAGRDTFYPTFPDEHKKSPFADQIEGGDDDYANLLAVIAQQHEFEYALQRIADSSLGYRISRFSAPAN